MVSNPDKITNVLKNGDEFFFLYKEKYKWSISIYVDRYYLHYYPEKTLPRSIEELARLDSQDFEYLQGSYITYSTDEYKSQEAKESFRELYTIVKEKVLDIDKTLQDIIDDDNVPF